MIEILLAMIFGLVAGSFLNVCIHRLPRDESVLLPRRSYCPQCRHTIAWYDNIPVASFFLLKRRCRNCQAPISWRYPLVEAITGALFAWSVYTHGWNLVGIKYCLFSAILVDLVFTDLETYILPDEFTLGGAVVGLVLAALTPAQNSVLGFFLPKWPGWVVAACEAAFAGVLVSGLLWLIGALYLRFRRKEGLGLGDVKRLLMVGIFLGLPNTLLTVFFGSVLGSIAGALYIRLSKKGWDHELPFGSFLGFAALLVGLFGEAFFRWYWKLG